MKKISSSSFGTRLGKAKELHAQLTTYTGYAPTADDLSVVQFGNLIDSTDKQNSDTAIKLQSYSTAVDVRQKNFLKESGALYHIALQISANVRSAFGKHSKEAASVDAMVKKLRGSNTKKSPTKPVAPETKSPDETTKLDDASLPNLKSISKSERTYGNMTKVFNDIIDTIETYGAKYKGSNHLTLVALKAKATALTEMNNSVAIANALLKQSRDDRTSLYIELVDRMERVKDSLMGQYGISSSEYKLAKALAA